MKKVETRKNEVTKTEENNTKNLQNSEIKKQDQTEEKKEVKIENEKKNEDINAENLPVENNENIDNPENPENQENQENQEVTNEVNENDKDININPEKEEAKKDGIEGTEMNQELIEGNAELMEGNEESKKENVEIIQENKKTETVPIEKKWTVEEYNELQKKFDDSQKMLLRLRGSNEKLRFQLKSISEDLSKKIKTAKLKKPEKKTGDDELKKIEVATKEIENCENQIKIYQKELNDLQKKSNVKLDSRFKIEKDLEDKDKEIKEKNAELKKFKKELTEIQKAQENPEIDAKINQEIVILSEELKSWREKKKKIELTQLIDEKNYKSQQEFIAKLQKKYEESCTQLGIEPTIAPLNAKKILQI